MYRRTTFHDELYGHPVEKHYLLSSSQLSLWTSKVYPLLCSSRVPVDVQFFVVEKVSVKVFLFISMILTLIPMTYHYFY